ncbi:MAG: DUF927 domain-containing protein, partial [Dehalobacter sp. 4CP]|nr:DUF927 domain-containing protein [Dehalobacter sp. 4CP]
CIRAEKQPYIRDAGRKNSYTATGWPLHSQDWLTFDEALDALQRGVKVYHAGVYRPVDGIGFLVARNGQDGPQTLGGDLDACRDPETGLVSPWAEEFLNEVRPFYTEVSPSKCGLRFFVWGRLPGGQDKVFAYGPQDDLPEESKERILTSKPKAREKLEKGLSAFNGLELYESGRHLTITGEKVEEFCFPRQDITEELRVALEPLLVSGATEKVSDAIRRGGRGRFPSLDILTVIDTSGFTDSGGQLFGPHPTLGSTSGKNLVVNPAKGIWAYMHNGINSGGDAWLWLACECGAVQWEEAGSGALKDWATVQKTFKHAVFRGLVSEEEVDIAQGPTIRGVSLEDSAGSVGLDNSGSIKKVECSKDGQKVLKWLSDCAVCIHTETVANNETEFCFKGLGAKDHREVSFTLPASALADPRKFRAALINAFGARNRIGHLDFETVQRLTKNTRLLRRVEVPAWDGSVPLVPGVNLVADVEFRLSPMTPAEVRDGDIEAAKECLRKLLSIHELSPVLVAAILGGPAFARWHNNDRFGVALWGLTGSLKTSVAQAALSVYGTGYLDDESILKHGKAGATQVATLEVFANAGILPQILDNVKTVNEKDGLQYISTIQAVIEGREKQRGKKDGGLRDSRVFNCLPIITGEIRPEEASTSARVLNLTWTRPEDLTALTFIQEHVAAMPIVGYHWLRFLATTDRNMVDGFGEARGRKIAEFSAKRYTNPGRMATIYSLLRAVWLCSVSRLLEKCSWSSQKGSSQASTWPLRSRAEW